MQKLVVGSFFPFLLLTRSSMFTILLNLLVLVYGYLDDNEIKELNELYNEWNGKYWLPCTWNMVIINDTNHDNYIYNHCALQFKNHTGSTDTNYYQYVYLFIT